MLKSLMLFCTIFSAVDLTQAQRRLLTENETFHTEIEAFQKQLIKGIASAGMEEFYAEVPLVTEQMEKVDPRMPKYISDRIGIEKYLNCAKEACTKILEEGKSSKDYQAALKRQLKVIRASKEWEAAFSE